MKKFENPELKLRDFTALNAFAVDVNIEEEGAIGGSGLMESD